LETKKNKNNKIALTEIKTLNLVVLYGNGEMTSWIQNVNTLHDSYQQLVSAEKLDNQNLQTAEPSGFHYLQPFLHNK